MIYLQLATVGWDPISAAIRFSTRSWCSHVEFVTGAGWTFGAQPFGGIRWRSPEESKLYTRAERFRVGGIQDALEWAETQTGKHYDLSAVFGMAFDRNWRSQGRFFCSELVALAFEKAGSPLLNPTADVWRITPRDLLLSPYLTKE